MKSQKQKMNTLSVNKTVTIQLPISNDHGIPVFEDFLTEIHRKFDVEKNIKNNLYAFILEHGLDDDLKHYSAAHDMSSPDGHKRAVASLFFNTLPGIKK